MTIFNPVEFAEGRHGPTAVNEVKRWLRGLDSVKRFEFIWAVLDRNEHLGLELVRTCQLEPIFLEAVLEKMLVYSDVSSVSASLEAVVRGLGHRRVLRIIRSHMDKAPLCVHKTLYWLPELYAGQEPELRAEVDELRAEFRARHPGYEPKRSTGTHA